MASFRRYRRPVPPGSIIVRLVLYGEDVMGFVRQVEDIDEEDATYPTEQKSVEQVLRLAESKRKAEPPGTVVFIELEPGVRWKSEWGDLENRSRLVIPLPVASIGSSR
jgi:hypothetical protein